MSIFKEIKRWVGLKFLDIGFWIWDKIEERNKRLINELKKKFGIFSINQTLFKLTQEFKELKKKVDKLDKRVSKLERWCKNEKVKNKNKDWQLRAGIRN
ncbi:MAG: hypothetical protein ACTSYM_00420 [Candidatus Baldrarchaeia archaeon]